MYILRSACVQFMYMSCHLVYSFEKEEYVDEINQVKICRFGTGKSTFLKMR